MWFKKKAPPTDRERLATTALEWAKAIRGVTINGFTCPGNGVSGPKSALNEETDMVLDLRSILRRLAYDVQTHTQEEQK